MQETLELNSKLTLLTKIFIFGILFEPLLFFVLAPGQFGNISRVLQLFFLSLLILICLMLVRRNASLKIKRASNQTNPFIVLFFISISFSLFFGIVNDNLSLKLNIFQLSFFDQGAFQDEVFKQLLREHLILIYYFFVFYLGSKTFIFGSDAIIYFFKMFKLLFIFNLIIGYIDLCFSYFGFDLISRHIYDGVNVGNRFHGISGEPRQAAVFLIYGLSMLYFNSLLLKERISRILVTTSICALLLTFSFTALIGIAITGILYFIFNIRIVANNIFRSTFYFSLIILSIMVLISNSRIEDYINVFSTQLYLLENPNQLPYLIRVQMGDIFPIYEQYKSLVSGRWIEILFGNGIGSSAVINFSYIQSIDGFGNPNSQLARFIYETGFIGLSFFILIFFWPIINSGPIEPKVKNNLFLLTSAIIGFALAVRSPVIYIYLAFLVKVIHQLKNYEE